MKVQLTMRANGRHERMHRTLKEETTRPAAPTLRLQQKKFDRFRQVFNYERPHEGLNNPHSLRNKVVYYSQKPDPRVS